MEVTILNPYECQEIFANWGRNSSICYSKKFNCVDYAVAEKIGKSCFKSGHFSGVRSEYIIFLIENVPRFTIDQAVRAEVGVFKNVQSLRYVNKGMFEFEIPQEIKDDDYACGKYLDCMKKINDTYNELYDIVLEKTGDKERATEQARYVLPIATHSSFIIGFTIEALIHFMNVRLCKRAEDVIREMAKQMKKEVIKFLPDLKDYLVPNCVAKFYCAESKGCGAYPSREEVATKLKELRYDISNS